MKRAIGACVVLALVCVPAAAAWAQDAGAGDNGQAADHPVNYFHWFVSGGQWVGYILIALSVVSVAMIVQHFIQLRRSVILPEAAAARIAQMLDSRQYNELLSFTQGDKSLLSYMMNRALNEAPHGFASMEQALEDALHERIAKLSLKPEILAILGNTGPLIGLYGTVLGIILAFSDIVRKGGIPEPGELAGSIGVALVATFWGLTVAIPSLVVYAIMKNRIELYSNDALVAGREFLSKFKRSAVRRPQNSAAASPSKQGE